jgi:hypothetical protein
MKKIKYLFLIAISILAFNSCADDIPEFTSELNYVTFGASLYSAGVDVGGSTMVDIPVYTTNVTGSDRMVAVYVDLNQTNADPGSYSVPTSVTIPGGSNEGKLSVSLSDVNLGIGVNKVVIDFDEVSGLYIGSGTSINYTQNCNEVSATLDINFDYYSSETSWEIQDSLGGVVVAGGNYGDGSAPVSEDFSLCIGRDYTLVFYDAYGDGMFDGDTLGSYTLTVGGDVKVSENGDFGGSQSNSFDTN